MIRHERNATTPFSSHSLRALADDEIRIVTLQVAAVALVAVSSVAPSAMSEKPTEVLSESSALTMAKAYFGNDKKAAAKQRVAGLAARTQKLSVGALIRAPRSSSHALDTQVAEVLGELSRRKRCGREGCGGKRETAALRCTGTSGSSSCSDSGSSNM
jgi:hypothetical protein